MPSACARAFRDSGALPLPLAVNPRGAATRTSAARLGALLNSLPPPGASQLAAQLAPPQLAHRWQRHHHLPKLRVAQREPRLQQRRRYMFDSKLQPSTCGCATATFCSYASLSESRHHHLLQLRVAQ